MTKHPEKAEETLKKEIKRVEELRRKAETIKKLIQDSRSKDDVFTNTWNGMGYDF